MATTELTDHAQDALDQAQAALDRAGDALHRAKDAADEQFVLLRDEAERAWDDPEQRDLLLKVGAGVGIAAVGLWFWRRRRKQQDTYETSVEEVGGWQDPREALATTAG